MGRKTNTDFNDIEVKFKTNKLFSVLGVILVAGLFGCTTNPGQNSKHRNPHWLMVSF